MRTSFESRLVPISLLAYRLYNNEEDVSLPTTPNSRVPSDDSARDCSSLYNVVACCYKSEISEWRSGRLVYGSVLTSYLSASKFCPSALLIPDIACRPMMPLSARFAILSFLKLSADILGWHQFGAVRTRQGCSLVLRREGIWHEEVCPTLQEIVLGDSGYASY